MGRALQQRTQSRVAGLEARRDRRTSRLDLITLLVVLRSHNRVLAAMPRFPFILWVVLRHSPLTTAAIPVTEGRYDVTYSCRRGGRDSHFGRSDSIPLQRLRLRVETLCDSTLSPLPTPLYEAGREQRWRVPAAPPAPRSPPPCFTTPRTALARTYRRTHSTFLCTLRAYAAAYHHTPLPRSIYLFVLALCTPRHCTAPHLTRQPGTHCVLTAWHLQVGWADRAPLLPAFIVGHSRLSLCRLSPCISGTHGTSYRDIHALHTCILHATSGGCHG